MKYDDASWHYGGDFPEHLDNKAGATHIGMFVAWCLLNGLAGELHTEEFPEDLEELKSRNFTPGQWFISYCDEKFTDEDLNELGNKFAEHYYAPDEPPYLEAYEQLLAQEVNHLYEVPDTWESFDLLAPRITLDFEKWSKSNG